MTTSRISSHVAQVHVIPCAKGGQSGESPVRHPAQLQARLESLRPSRLHPKPPSRLHPRPPSRLPSRTLRPLQHCLGGLPGTAPASCADRWCTKRPQFSYPGPQLLPEVSALLLSPWSYAAKAWEPTTPLETHLPTAPGHRRRVRACWHTQEHLELGRKAHTQEHLEPGRKAQRSAEGQGLDNGARLKEWCLLPSPNIQGAKEAGAWNER